MRGEGGKRPSKDCHMASLEVPTRAAPMSCLAYVGISSALQRKGHTVFQGCGSFILGDDCGTQIL